LEFVVAGDAVKIESLVSTDISFAVGNEKPLPPKGFSGVPTR
jgi:hypothetical protein